MQSVTDFFENWVSENIGADPYASEGGPDECPNERAEACLAAAKEAGFEPKEIIDKYGPFLSTRMADEIEAAMKRDFAKLIASPRTPARHDP